jgi:DNA polymerase III subunit chi
MTEVRFYHLSRATAAQALPDLLEKTLARGWRAVVRLHSPAQVEAMAEHLWTYRADSFLPHGTDKDGSAKDQPIWLTAQDERPNKADVLFLVDGAAQGTDEAYALICELFDGQSDALVQTARERWSRYKEQSYALTYWQQSERGWQKKEGA